MHKSSFDLLIYGPNGTYKNSSVCHIQNLKTRHSYNVTCNPCKVELNTKIKLWNWWMNKPCMDYRPKFWCVVSCIMWLKYKTIQLDRTNLPYGLMCGSQNTGQILGKSYLQISSPTHFWHNLQRGQLLKDEFS
jgi:hypothetical protein